MLTQKEKEASRYETYLRNNGMFLEMKKEEQNRMDKDLRIINISGLGFVITFVGYLSQNSTMDYECMWLVFLSLVFFCTSVIWSLFTTFFSIEQARVAAEKVSNLYKQGEVLTAPPSLPYGKFINFSNGFVFALTSLSLISFVIFIILNS